METAPKTIFSKESTIVYKVHFQPRKRSLIAFGDMRVVFEFNHRSNLTYAENLEIQVLSGILIFKPSLIFSQWTTIIIIMMMIPRGDEFCSMFGCKI